MTKYNSLFAFAVFAFVAHFSPAVSFAQFGTEAHDPNAAQGHVQLPTKFDPNAIGYGPISQPTPSGKLSIAMEHSVKEIIGQQRFEHLVREFDQHVSNLDKQVDSLQIEFDLIGDDGSRETLIKALNELRNAKTLRSNFRRYCRSSLTAQFDGKTFSQKGKLMLRAVEKGIVGKTIVFRTNSDGSIQAKQYEGKVNYSKSTDVSHLFN